jgi:hypothetical protein
MVNQSATEQLTSAIGSDIAHLRGRLKKVERAPRLWRLNGCGTTLLGHLRMSSHSNAYFTRLFITVLWVPIIPLDIFIVAQNSRSYEFLGQMTPADFHGAYRADIARFYFQILGQTLAVVGAVLGAVALIGWITTLSGVHHAFFRFRL